MIPIDRIFAGFDPSAHVIDDLFANKLAFSCCSTFRLPSTSDRAGSELVAPAVGRKLAWHNVFSKRLPATVNQAIAKRQRTVMHTSRNTIIWMDHLIDARTPPLSAGLRLISHWNLRDEIKAIMQTKREDWPSSARSPGDGADRDANDSPRGNQ